MRNALYSLDIWLLMAFKVALEFLNEWLSLRQCWIERALIAMYAVCAGIQHELRHEAGGWWVFIVICILLLILNHAQTNATRIYWLLQGRGCSSRLLTLVCFLFTIADILIAPVIPQDLFRAVEWTAWTLVVFVTALPSGGTPGRKRKAAIAKIVDQFGREYVPDAA